MKRITFSQILFLLSFLFSQLFWPEGMITVLFIYVFFLWLWLSIMARRTVRHEAVKQRGKVLTNTNLGCSIVVLLLFPYFLFVLGSLKALLIMMGFSCTLHLLIIYENIGLIAPGKNKVVTFFQLLFYPWGVFTVQPLLSR